MYPNVKYYMLLGDFNSDFGEVNGRKMKDFCTLHNLTHVINEPTRFTATTQTCLYQILVNMPNFVKKVKCYTSCI